METQSQRSLVVFLFVFLLMVTAIAAAGYLSYQNYESRFRIQAESQLAAIAGLKVEELEDWRKERLSDAEILFRNPGFSALIWRFLEHPHDLQAGSELQTWLSKYLVHGQYDRIFLLDVQGMERLSSPSSPETVAPHLMQEVSSIINARKVTFLDFHRDTPEGKIHLEILVPIFSPHDDRRSLGILVLRIDPSVYLYPYIQQWPVPSLSAETLLVRREGDYVLFLNELKFQTGTALNLSIPMENAQVPAVKAALGQEGIVEGMDYRGESVIAALRAVPDSPWRLVARVDRTEVYAPMQERMWQTLIFFGTLIALSGVGLGLVLRQQQVRFYRRQLETAQALRESEERHRITLMSVGDAVISTDLEGRVHLLNPVAEALTGWMNPEAHGKPLEEIFHIVNEETHLAVENPVVRVLREGVVVGLADHTLLIAKDGAEWPIADAGAPIRNDQGTITGVVLVFRDQSAERAAQRELLESEEKFRNLAENANDGILIASGQGVRLYANTRASEITGYSVAELFKIPLKDLVHPDESKKMEEIRRKRLAGEAVESQYETVIVRKGGETIPIEITGATTVWQGQTATIAILRDITARKRQEAEMLMIQDELRAALEKAVQSRRVLLSVIEDHKRSEEEREKLQEQLVQSRKLEAIGKLAGGIAHDFNNLLTPIIGNAEMLLMELCKDNSLYEVMEEIKKAGERAASLTKQLLAFSRKQILQPEVLSLNHVVGGIERLLRRLIGEDIEIKTILDQGLGKVKVDPSQIEQVLMNLAVNARDAMPGGGKLTIETRNVDLNEDYVRDHISVIPGPYVILAVSDTGIGMSKEVQDQIFEPFYTTKEKGKGTGLGLSTVYGIIKQSKGNIWVYSEPGKGSTFKIYLPRVEETVHVTEEERGKGAPLQGSETILVVEDDEMVRKMAIKILRRHGYTVLAAGDAQEAIRICRDGKEQFQMMLTDVVMPGMSGRDLAEELQKMQPGLKVLFMSGYTDNAIVHHGILEEGIAFIQKPFTPEGLARKVREVMGGKEEG